MSALRQPEAYRTDAELAAANNKKVQAGRAAEKAKAKREEEKSRRAEGERARQTGNKAGLDNWLKKA